MKNNLTRAFGLVRVSTQIQTEEHGGTGLSFQSEKLSQYAKLNDFNLVKTISDVASGGLETRDGIEELKSHIENNDVDIVLIWNVSRAFRSMIYFADFYKYLKKHNVELISVSEGIRSSRKEGEMMFGIMASIAGYEKELINERMMSGRTKLRNSTTSSKKITAIAVTTLDCKAVHVSLSALAAPFIAMVTPTAVASARRPFRISPSIICTACSSGTVSFGRSCSDNDWRPPRRLICSGALINSTFAS